MQGEPPATLILWRKDVCEKRNKRGLAKGHEDVRGKEEFDYAKFGFQSQVVHITQAVTIRVFKTAPVINENSVFFVKNLHLFLTFGSTGEKAGNLSCTERVLVHPTFILGLPKDL